MPRLNPSIKWLLLLICIAPISAQGQSERGSQKWRDLFDGKTMQDWKKTNYGGEGDCVYIEGDGVCVTFQVNMLLEEISEEGVSLVEEQAVLPAESAEEGSIETENKEEV